MNGVAPVIGEEPTSLGGLKEAAFPGRPDFPANRWRTKKYSGQGRRWTGRGNWL